ncbi:hypothetical protein PIB30_039600 [Stylosanthes scabra]|uniref:Uncharacterized protein n=1 Tax=Stylosanthes scabra TaxID=79078 RepID=A0ABU6YBR2_9FABA|nr:hypothetical protein [Stylosanthes scabra]
MITQQVQPQHKPLPAIPSPLPSQPLPNPKGGLNTINDKPESEKEVGDTNNEEAEQQLYELLIDVTGSKDEEDVDIGEILDFCEEFNSDYKEEESEKEKLVDGWGSETETQSGQGEMLSINTISNKKEDKEELPTKCEDPGPCLVTCKIKGFEIPSCLCDPGACGNVSPVIFDHDRIKAPIDARFAAMRRSCRPLSIYHTCNVWYVLELGDRCPQAWVSPEVKVWRWKWMIEHEKGDGLCLDARWRDQGSRVCIVLGVQGLESTPHSKFHEPPKIESIRRITEPIRFHPVFKFNVQNALKIDSSSSESILRDGT